MKVKITDYIEIEINDKHLSFWTKSEETGRYFLKFDDGSLWIYDPIDKEFYQNY